MHDQQLQEMRGNVVPLTNARVRDRPPSLAVLGQTQNKAKHAHSLLDAFVRFRLARDDPCRRGRELARVADTRGLPVRAEDSVHVELAVEHPLLLDVFVDLLDRFPHQVELV